MAAGCNLKATASVTGDGLDIDYKQESLPPKFHHKRNRPKWYIENFPSKQHMACLAHIYLTLALYNVACAYKTERGQELADRGIRRLRAQHLGGAAWVLVVYTETEYGIFDVEEFAHLSGNPPKRFHRFRP